jgi:hypothetical protein
VLLGALKDLSQTFEKMYRTTGRPSVIQVVGEFL